MDSIESCISFLLAKASQQVTRRAKALLAPHGVTPAQYAVLRVLAHGEQLSGADLAARLALDSASITGLIDRMDRQGLVTRRPDTRDRRIQWITPTAQAIRLLPALDDAMDQLNREVAALLTPDRPDALWTDLTRIARL